MGFTESVWTLADCCWRAGWCTAKQTRRALISVWLWAKFSTCTAPPSPLCHCSCLIKGWCDMPKGKTQPHTEMNNPGHLLQDTRAKPVPLLTTRKVFLVFIFCNCFKTATPQETNGKKCRGIRLLWIQLTSKPQRWSITNFWSELIKSRDSQTLGEALKEGTEQLEFRGVEQPQNVDQKSRKLKMRNGWKWVGLLSLRNAKRTQCDSP